MNELIKKLNMSTREELVEFLKSMWAENPMPCPIFSVKLDYFHKKAKKSS